MGLGDPERLLGDAAEPDRGPPGEVRAETLSGAFGAVSLARTLNNAPPNPLLIDLSRDNERMISGHVLRALQRRGCCGLSAAPHVSLRWALKPVISVPGGPLPRGHLPCGACEAQTG